MIRLRSIFGDDMRIKRRLDYYDAGNGPSSFTTVFTPGYLFTSGAQGAWYDPSDFSTLYQDAAGTTPVTAVEQPVRLMLDRSGRGNNATAPNDASRPILRARYNLLTFSEQFNDAVWTKGDGATVTANATTAPDGTLTADQIDFAASELSRIQQPILTATTETYTFSVWLRVASGSETIRFGHATNLSSITVTNTWQRFTANQLINAGDSANLTLRNSAAGGAKTVFAWGAQLLTSADQSSTGGAYQRIAAATDYDTSNPVWRPYLAFDGVDDHFTLASAINITTDMTVVRGFGRSAAGIRSIGLGTSGVNIYDGYWFTNNTTVSAMGGSGAVVEAANTATGSFVFTSRRNASTSTVRRNGTQIGSVSAPSVINSFGAIGLMNVAYNNGPIYGLIVLDRELTGSELTATEQWMAGKTGVNLP